MAALPRAGRALGHTLVSKLGLQRRHVALTTGSSVFPVDTSSMLVVCSLTLRLFTDRMPSFCKCLAGPCTAGVPELQLSSISKLHLRRRCSCANVFCNNFGVFCQPCSDSDHSHSVRTLDLQHCHASQCNCRLKYDQIDANHIEIRLSSIGFVV